VKDGDVCKDAKVDAVGVGQGNWLVGREAVGSAIEVGAVGGAQVFQMPCYVSHHQACVMMRDEIVVEVDVVCGARPDQGGVARGKTVPRSELGGTGLDDRERGNRERTRSREPRARPQPLQRGQGGRPDAHARQLIHACLHCRSHPVSASMHTAQGVNRIRSRWCTVCTATSGSVSFAFGPYLSPDGRCAARAPS